MSKNTASRKPLNEVQPSDGDGVSVGKLQEMELAETP